MASSPLCIAPTYPKPSTPSSKTTDGYLWLSSIRGITRVSAFRTHRLRSITPTCILHPIYYGYADGMPTEETSTIGHPTAWKTTDGLLWFATRKGVAIADPNHLPENRIPPPTVIERFTVDDTDLPISSTEQTIPPGHSRFVFDYAGLSYVAPSRSAIATSSKASTSSGRKPAPAAPPTTPISRPATIASASRPQTTTASGTRPAPPSPSTSQPPFYRKPLVHPSLRRARSQPSPFSSTASASAASVRNSRPSSPSATAWPAKFTTPSPKASSESPCNSSSPRSSSRNRKSPQPPAARSHPRLRTRWPRRSPPQHLGSPRHHRPALTPHTPHPTRRKSSTRASENPINIGGTYRPLAPNVRRRSPPHRTGSTNQHHTARAGHSSLRRSALSFNSPDLDHLRQRPWLRHYRQLSRRQRPLRPPGHARARSPDQRTTHRRKRTR